MTTEHWIAFWRYLLYGSIGLYFVIAVAVAIGAAFDVSKLLRLLTSSDDAPKPPSPYSTDTPQPSLQGIHDPHPRQVPPAGLGSDAATDRSRSRWMPGRRLAI